LTITDKDLIADIESGKKELSVGYTNVLVQKDGTYKGEDYKYIQTDIKANHVAVVDAGRCGGICSLMLDAESNKNKKDGNMPKIKIGEDEFEVDAKVADEFKKLKASSEKMDEVEEEVKEKEKALDKMTAKYDTLKSEKQTVEKKLNDSATMLNDAVAAKIDLVTFAKDCKVDVKLNDDNLAIKQAIVKSFDMDSVGKSETYLNAAIDMKKASIKAAKNSFDKVADETKDKGTKVLDAKEIGERTIGGNK